MEIKEFVLSSKPPKYFLQSFVYQPLNVEEEKLGWLLMIGKIKASSLEYLSFLNLLASRIKREYFSNTSFSSQKAFEFALKKGREVLKEYQEKLNISSEFDFLVLSLLPKKVHFSQIGKVNVLILRENKKVEIFDLSKEEGFENEVLFPLLVLKTSEIQKNDLLILSTSNIFSKEKFLGKNFPLKDADLEELAKGDEEGIALTIKLTQGAPKFSHQEKILTPKKEIGLKLKAKSEKLLKFFKENPLRIKGFKPTFFKLSKIKGFKFRFSFPKFSLWSLGTLLLLLFAIFVTLWHQKKTHEFLEKVNQIKKLVTEASSARIYGKNKEAVLALNQALKMIAELENKKLSSKQKDLIRTLQNDAQKAFEEIFPKNEIKNLELIFEMKETINKWKPEKMLLSNNFIYLSSQNSNLVWRLNQKTKEGIFIPLAIDKVKFSLVFGKNPIFLAPDGQIESWERKISLILPNKSTEIKDVALFSKNLYILSDDQILKYNLASGAKEVVSQNWLKENISLKDFFSITIDGKIYLLSSKKILRLGRGKIETEFDLAKIYPRIQKPTKIFTQQEIPFLYLQDKNEIIILDKEGNFVKLLSFPQVKNLVDFFIDTSNKAIYILDGMKIWKAKI